MHHILEGITPVIFRNLSDYFQSEILYSAVYQPLCEQNGGIFRHAGLHTLPSRTHLSQEAATPAYP